MSDLQVQVHGSSAKAARFGPSTFNAVDFREDLIVPVIPNGIGGVIKPNIDGRVWMYVPVPSFTHIRRDDRIWLDYVRVRGFIGRDADYEGTIVLKDASQSDSQITGLLKPPSRLSGERIDFTSQVSASGRVFQVEEFSLVLVMQIEFRGDSRGPEHFFTCHNVEAGFTRRLARQS